MIWPHASRKMTRKSQNSARMCALDKLTLVACGLDYWATNIVQCTLPFEACSWMPLVSAGSTCIAAIFAKIKKSAIFRRSRWHQALTKARLTIKHLHNRIYNAPCSSSNKSRMQSKRRNANAGFERLSSTKVHPIVREASSRPHACTPDG